MVVEYLESIRILGNTGVQVIIALTVFFGVNALLYLFKEIVLVKAKHLTEKTATTADDKIIETISSLPMTVYIVFGAWAASNYLSLTEFWQQTLDIAVLVILGYVAIKLVSIVIDVLIVLKSSNMSEQQQSMMRLVSRITKMFLWILAILMLLDNFGVKIGPLLAGVGIGGLAIAFAFQSVIEDLFAAFSIYFDKPFEVGDYIVLSGGDNGIVHHIGLRTTRVQTLQGQELVVSNRELTSSRVQNYKKMQKRRVVFGFGVEYGTTLPKLKKINSIIQDIFNEIEHADLDRTHFTEFADSSLNYEVVYYLNTRDYTVYRDAQQQVNFEIVKRFKKAKISMAFPTRTLHIKK